MLFNIQWWRVTEEVGVTNAEGPPVPIPNTEVKLCSGENTLLEAAREDSSMPTQARERIKPFPKPEKRRKPKPNNSAFCIQHSALNYGGVAQLGEHLPCKQGVMGSNPIISTRSKKASAKWQRSLTNHIGS